MLGGILLLRRVYRICRHIYVPVTKKQMNNIYLSLSYISFLTSISSPESHYIYLAIWSTSQVTGVNILEAYVIKEDIWSVAINIFERLASSHGGELINLKL